VGTVSDTDGGTITSLIARTGRLGDGGAVVTMGYLAALAERSVAVGSVLCVGIDPAPDAVPNGFSAGLAGVERFARLIVEAAAPVAAAMKPNLAFFEAFGSPGLAALERLRAAVPPGIPVIADAKRGDVETTVARQAVALYERLGVDAVTASPYLGLGALGPFLERVGGFTYVLCRTSNRAAGELQDLVVAADEVLGFPAEPLHRRVARLVASAGLGDRAGLVVGATGPAELASLRALVPGLAFLVPGVGAQGGDAGGVLAHGAATARPAGERPGGGLLVNVSRGIAEAALGPPRPGQPSDPGDRLAEAARAWATKLPVLR
jgi:orotidine-5'-phosphate decarboxylase